MIIVNTLVVVYDYSIDSMANAYSLYPMSHRRFIFSIDFYELDPKKKFNEIFNSKDKF